MKKNANTPEHRAIAAYLGLALGDALGATVEFMTPREIRAQYGIHKEIIGGGWLHLKPGQVTDDTTMSLALGEAILADHGQVHALSAARAFDAWMRAKPVDIGNTVRRGIVRFRQTGDPISPPNDNDGGNGACMRVLPVALATFGAPREIIEKAVLAQAHVTHNQPLSDAGSLAVVDMIHMALQGKTLGELLRGPVLALISQHGPFAFRKQRTENPSGYIVHTLQVVFQAFFDTDNFESCIVEAVNRGGDADTTGAIAGMIAGAYYGLNDLPARWLRALNKDMRIACEHQARGLMALMLAKNGRAIPG